MKDPIETQAEMIRAAGAGKWLPKRGWAMALLVWVAGGPSGCGATPVVNSDLPDLRINEVVSKNEGVWVDEGGEADDYVELVNASDHPIDIGEYRIAESSGSHQLPTGLLAPGAVQLLWADDTPAQGTFHMPFKMPQRLNGSLDGGRLMHKNILRGHH